MEPTARLYRTDPPADHRCYDAAMEKPWQFSLWRLLAMVALVSVAAFLVELPAEISPGSSFRVFLFVPAGAAGGAGIGLIFHRPWRFALVGAILPVCFLGFLFLKFIVTSTGSA